MPYAIPYRRWSSDRQSKGDSRKRQTDSFLSFCQRHGLEPWEEKAISDDGVSAFNGKHLRGGNLADFLVLVESGKIPKGTCLVVENQDRISRDQVNNTLKLFNRILENGVNIGDALTDSIVTEESMNDPLVLMRIVLGAQRAYEYSLSLSRRLKSAWKSKRDSAATKVVSKTGPFWLELSQDRKNWVECPEEVAKVRSIFTAALEGDGVTRMAKKFNDQGLLTHSGKKWMPSNLLKLLTNRAVLGEFQPKVQENGKPRPCGKAVPNYFPRIISQDLFDRVQLNIADRSVNRKGRDTKSHDNLFKGLLYDASNGNSYHQKHSYGRKVNGEYPNKKIVLVSVYDTHGGQTSLDYDRFCTAFFKHVTDLDLSSFQEESPAALELGRLTAKLASLDGKIEKIGRMIAVEDEIDHLLDTRRELQATRVEVVEKLHQVELAARNPLVEVVQEVQSLIRENPSLVKSKMRLLLARMEVSVRDEGTSRQVTVECRYRNGCMRMYTFSYSTAKGQVKGAIQEHTNIIVCEGSLSLSGPDHKMLEELEPKLIETFWK